jgi:hypothetical protein
LAPLSNSQQLLIVWLERYFNKFGDKAPNRKETDLLIMAEKNVYQQYEKEIIKLKEKPVTVSMFISI